MYSLGFLLLNIVHVVVRRCMGLESVRIITRNSAQGKQTNVVSNIGGQSYTLPSITKLYHGTININVHKYHFYFIFCLIQAVVGLSA